MDRDPYPFATSNEPVATLRDVWRWTLAGFAFCALMLLVQYAGFQAMGAEQQRMEQIAQERGR